MWRFQGIPGTTCFTLYVNYSRGYVDTTCFTLYIDVGVKTCFTLYIIVGVKLTPTIRILHGLDGLSLFESMTTS